MDSVLGAIVDTISQMGALGVSTIVIWALVTERLVPRGRLDDMKADRDRIAGLLAAARVKADTDRLASLLATEQATRSRR